MIQIRNNYDLGVFNGDIGRVTRIDTVEQELHTTFDGRGVVYDYADLDELVLAYATSVHKSQGTNTRAWFCPCTRSTTPCSSRTCSTPR